MTTTSTPEKARTWNALVRELFQALDKDQDSYLNCKELRIFWELMGFDYDNDVWAQEFSELCKEFHANPAHGISLGTFGVLLDDESEKGCYCSNDDINTIL